MAPFAWGGPWQSPAPRKKTTSPLPSRFYSNLSYTWPSYPAKLQEVLDENIKSNSASQLALSSDLFGLYFPMASRPLLIGGLLGATMDHYSITNATSQIWQFTLSGSGIFFSDAIGNGSIFRADIGMCLAFASGSTTTSAWSAPGYYITIGSGYAYPLTSTLSLLLQGNVSLRKIENNNYSLMTLGLGLLY